MRRVTIAMAAVAAVAVVSAFTVRARTSDAASPSQVAAATALDDAAIVAIFDLANTADIETGQLGAQRAQNKEVRDYGRMLSDVHTAVRQKGRDLAAKLGVTPKLPDNDTSLRDHQAVMKKLSALKGAEFDRAFLEHEEAFHAAVLSAVKSTLLPAIQNKELKDFVTSLAPAFEAHRLAAENLSHKLTASER